MLIIVAALLGLVALAGLVLRTVPPQVNLQVAATAVAPYLMIAAPVALVLLALARRWPGVIVAGVLTVGCALTQLPLYLGSAPIPHARHLTTMTSNLLLGRADPAAVVRAVRAHQVEVLIVQELTADEQDRFAAAGLSSLLPYQATEPREAAAGVGIWSRYPLTDVRHVPGFGFALVTARVTVPGLPVAPLVVATHLPGPWPAPAAAWLRDMGRLPGFLHALDPDVPVLVGGDFNATSDMVQFRRLVTAGYHDAAQQAGAGHTRSYPADSWLPPIIAIDHVLLRGGRGSSARTVTIRGSDHRALLVDVELPAARHPPQQKAGGPSR